MADPTRNPDPVRWDWKGYTGPNGHEQWSVPGGSAYENSDGYWEKILADARRLYGDQGIHFASGSQVSGKEIPAGTAGDKTRYLVDGDGKPLPSSGELTWRAPDDGRRWTAQPDGSYQVFGSTDPKDRVQPDYYTRAADGKLVAMKDGKPIFAHPGATNPPEGWTWDPASNRYVHTADKGGDESGGKEGDESQAPGEGEAGAGREGGEDASKARQELQSQTDGKILALINDVQQQNEKVKTEIKKLREDIAEKWRSLGDQINTPAGKKDFANYVDERIQQVRKMLTDANLLNESAAARARGAGTEYDPAGTTEQGTGDTGGGGTGDTGSGDTGAGDTGTEDTGTGDTGVGDDTAVDDPISTDDTGTVEDPTDTSTAEDPGTTQPTTTEQPQATQQQQQPMSMPTMPTMSTPTMPDVSGLVSGLKGLIDEQNSKDDPSKTEGDETEDPTKVDPGETAEDTSNDEDPTVVPEESSDGDSGSGDAKESDGKDGDSKDDDAAKPEGDKPAAEGVKPDTSTTVTLPGDAGTAQAANPALAAAGRSVIGGQPIADAFKAQGISLPPAGSPITDPVSTSELKFGDVGQFKDHQILSLGGDKVLVNGQVQPLSSLSTDSGFLGFFRPGQTGVGDGTSAPTPTAPAAVATGVGTGASGGAAGAAPSAAATTPAAPAAPAGVGS
ncbi:DUF4226 domain-containing protein [Tsukamurella ocularis]|uniref:DUF4226 domain-containing protein n=1 Tax=Tsukamurella ocularis TaxID=1970234 RepID=UPI00216909CB|nr:DUF4226 domain-containing protein [Tsukamurella ocularis]MCS3853315.1 hypothetical protein [Tsukamurella ocularis]